MNIIIETIPHSEQRYLTVGDWKRDTDGTLRIRVSEEIGNKYALLVALHELIEVSLCEDRGITCEQVDAFDMKFEQERKPGDDSEPGNHADAPYRNEHVFATAIEREMATQLGVDWEQYEKTLNALP